jgi:hypothetical protein
MGLYSCASPSLSGPQKRLEVMPLDKAPEPKFESEWVAHCPEGWTAMYTDVDYLPTFFAPDDRRYFCSQGGSILNVISDSTGSE